MSNKQPSLRALSQSRSSLPRPPGLADQLRWVHDLLRRDLLTVRELAAEVSSGAHPDDVRAGLRELQSNGPLFQLRANCLSYCQLVHSHHHNEDAVLFPAVRRSAPHLAKIVDRLEDDHRIVAELLDRVVDHARDLDAVSVRQQLVAALGRLSTHLLEHLELEEQTLQPVLDAWTDWPASAPSEIRERASARSGPRRVPRGPALGEPESGQPTK